MRQFDRKLFFEISRRFCRLVAATFLALVVTDAFQRIASSGSRTHAAAPQDSTPTASGALPPMPSDAAVSQAQPTPPPAPVPVAIPFKRLVDIDLNIRPHGELLPEDVATAYFAQATPNADPTSRNWAIKEFTWEAPGFCYRPLYFEEVCLERSGVSYGIAQPAVSSAQFFGRSLALPGLMAIHPPHECVYPLGYHRPGNALPYYLHGPQRHR
jgi:hypothetical protein